MHYRLLLQELGYTVPHATLLVLLFGIGAAVGGVAGGAAGNALYRRGGPVLQTLCFAAIQASSSLPMLWLINQSPIGEPTAAAILEAAKAPPGAGSLVYAVVIIAGVLAAGTGPNLKAILMNVNRSDTRGSVFTMAYLFDSIAKGVAPTLVGLVVASLAGSRGLVLSAAICGWVVSGAIIAVAAAFVTRDEADARHAQVKPG